MNIVIYLLHFSSPVRRCNHYLGSTRADQFARRMREHGNGNGARLCALAVQQQVTMRIVRIWQEPDRQREFKLKRAGHFRLQCPICQAPESERAAKAEHYRLLTNCRNVGSKTLEF